MKKIKEKLLFCFTVLFLQSSVVFASSVGSSSSRQWPWTRLLNEIMEEFTGPLPITLGILGIVVCCFSLYSGNHGEGTKKLLLICLMISLAIFAPTLVGYITDSAGGHVLR